MGHTEEFLKKKFVIFNAERIVFSATCCRGLGLFTQHSCATGIMARIWMEQTFQLRHSGKKLVLTSNYFEKRKKKEQKLARRAARAALHTQMLPSAPWALQTWPLCPGSCSLCAAKTTSLSTSKALLNTHSLS